MGAPFHIASLSLPAASGADSSDLEAIRSICVCACLSDQRKLCQSTALEAWSLILHSKEALIVSGTAVIARGQAGAQNWTQP